LSHGEFLEYFDCSEGSGVIRWKTSSKTGKRRAICRCRLGSCPIDKDKIRTWDIQIGTLIDRIGEAMGFTPPFKEVMPKVYSFGRKMRREFYYIRSIPHEAERAIQAFFKRLPTAVLMIPDECFRSVFELILPDNRVFYTAKYCSMDFDCRLSFDMQPIENDLSQSEVADKKPQTRRLEKIDRLITAMKEHFQIARDFYYSNGTLLRRPTQADLAKRTGTSQDVVSRCLADEKAVVLRTLWNNAENLEAILNS